MRLGQGGSLAAGGWPWNQPIGWIPLAGMSADEHILVVGGSAGIGAALVQALGPRCSLWSRSSGVDARSDQQVATAAEALLAREGAPYGLVHCVGDFAECPILDTDMSLYQDLLDSNLGSALRIVRALVPAMAELGRGRVILFAAAGAGDPGAKTRAPIYFAAKAAVLSMARSLAAEVAARGVTVNVISPGIIRHQRSHRASQQRLLARVPLGRAGQPADLVGAVQLLLSEQGAYITGSEITIDGGLSLRAAPG